MTPTEWAGLVVAIFTLVSGFAALVRWLVKHYLYELKPLLPSAAHVHQNPNSDHNSGHAVDLTHDPLGGIDCRVIYSELQKDKRVKYLIFRNRIWSRSRGENTYGGANPHNKHLHVSIYPEFENDTSDWFPWTGGPKKWNKVKSKFIRVKRKKKDPTSPKED